MSLQTNKQKQNTTQEKYRARTQMLAKGKQLMILLKHPSVLIAWYLDIFTPGKSRDLNSNGQYKETLWIGTKGCLPIS
jgi:hypothetical protein